MVDFDFIFLFCCLIILQIGIHRNFRARVHRRRYYWWVHQPPPLKLPPQFCGCSPAGVSPTSPPYSLYPDMRSFLALTASRI